MKYVYMFFTIKSIYKPMKHKAAQSLQRKPYGLLFTNWHNNHLGRVIVKQ